MNSETKAQHVELMGRYQRGLISLSQYHVERAAIDRPAELRSIAELESEVARLRDEVRLYKGKPVTVESVHDIDREIERLQELRQRLIKEVPHRADTQRAWHDQLVTLQAVLRRYDITLPKSKLTMQAGWRALVPELYGSIEGCPTLVGKLICTNGVVAIMILSASDRWAEVHIKHFIPVDNQDEGLEQLGRATRSRNPAKVQRTQEQLVKYLLDIG